MRSGALLFAAASACALVLSVRGDKLKPAKACQDLRCPKDMLFRGTFTNASYFWDEDFRIWRPNMDYRRKSTVGTNFDPALATSVTWKFEGERNCGANGEKGVDLFQFSTVWGQPPQGPPPSALDVGAQLQQTKYCCTVEGDVTSGRCYNGRCQLAGQDGSSKVCNSDAQCGVCNMVMTYQTKDQPVKSPHPSYDKKCEFIMASSKMRFNYLSFQSDLALTGKEPVDPITGKDLLNKSIIMAFNDVPNMPPQPNPIKQSVTNSPTLVTDVLLLEVDNEDDWPLPQCEEGGAGYPFRHMSDYTSMGCRSCSGTGGSEGSTCTNRLNINCLNARFAYVPLKPPTLPYILVSAGGGALFLISWMYLFWAVREPEAIDSSGVDEGPGLPAGGDGGGAASPYVSRRKALRCDGCGSSIDNKSAKFCPFCGGPRSKFLAFNAQTGQWEEMKSK